MDCIAASHSQRKTRIRYEKRNSYLCRFQLLRHHEIARLCDVMETVVPIHGAGNFPTLDIKPTHLVQLVRDRLQSIGIKVRDIRLNGSAATHVLSDDASHTYKDLDLIFAIDFPSHPPQGVAPPQFEENRLENPEETDSNDRPAMLRPTSLPSDIRIHSPHPSEKDSLDDSSSVDESGYTSGGSSVASMPPSPCHFGPGTSSIKSRKRFFRSRTRSLESMSSTSSVTSPTLKPPLDDVSSTPPRPTSTVDADRHNWQGIKDATMDVLLDFLPPRVNRTNMSSLVLGNAYVQKMVKVSTDTDKWSLISLNNNSGRNLELKFVQSMKRQYEFSVDSFQVILDTYLAYHQAVSDIDSNIETSERFFPTVLAESVYGDFAAAICHLRQRRICTHRPEEIRGGGLLRYCNLLVRDFTPGDGEESQDEATNSIAIMRLEQHMCSRFFIDFGDIEHQQKKLLSYLDSHFVNEDELKFQYLLVLRKVVDTSTICLMQHERTMILDLITVLARQSLANNLGKNLPEARSNFHRAPFGVDYRASHAMQPDANYGPEYLPSSNPFYVENSSNHIHSRPSTPSSLPNYIHEKMKMPPSNNCYVRPPFCCPCCHQYFPSSYYYAAPSYLPNLKVENYPMLMQPIYFDQNRMTCVYQPAGYRNSSSKPCVCNLK